MQTTNIYFISGSSGVGKTTVMTEIQKSLPKNYETHDFDENGVPSGADHAWRLKETKKWIELGKEKAEQSISLVVFGFFNPEELKDIVPKDFPFTIETILLDARAEVIEERLRDRNKNKDALDSLERVTGSAEEFINNNTRFVPIIRDICQRHGCKIIDTTDLKPGAVAEQIRETVFDFKLQ